MQSQHMSYKIENPQKIKRREYAKSQTLTPILVLYRIVKCHFSNLDFFSDLGLL